MEIIAISAAIDMEYGFIWLMVGASPFGSTLTALMTVSVSVLVP